MTATDLRKTYEAVKLRGLIRCAEARGKHHLALCTLAETDAERVAHFHAAAMAAERTTALRALLQAVIA